MDWHSSPLQTDVIEPSPGPPIIEFEAPEEPSTTTPKQLFKGRKNAALKTPKRKRTLSAVIRDIPDPKNVLFEPLPASRFDAALNLPVNCDTDDPYALFCYST
jgi:hypothetical protein